MFFKVVNINKRFHKRLSIKLKLHAADPKQKKDIEDRSGSG